MDIPKTKKSGGPQLPKGKSTASCNALKTGAYAVQYLLPGEDPAHYTDLLAQFQRDFAPYDVAEAAEAVMVRDLAVIMWKQLRIEKMQHSILIAAMARPVTLGDLGSIAGFYCPQDRFDGVEIVLRDDFEAQVAAQRQFVHLFGGLSTSPSKAFIATLKKKFPEEYAELKHEFAEAFEYEGDFDDALIDAKMVDARGVGISYLQRYFDQGKKYREYLFGWIAPRRSCARPFRW